MVEEHAKRATEINQRFLCVTDHGAMGAIPRQIRACEENKISPIFGCELYINPIQPEFNTETERLQFIKNIDPDIKAQFRKSYHLLAIAYNNTGYSNLVKLSSWGWTKGFYYRPRVNHEQLMKYKEGIVFSSCCYNGEIGQAFDKGGEEAGEAMLVKYMKMFHPHFYLEFILLDFDKQKPYNAFIMKMHDKYGIPLIISQDCHYTYKDDSHMQSLMLMVQTGKTIQDIQKAKEADETADFFELQDKNLWMKSEEEIDEKWESDYQHIVDYELLKEAKRNTVRICELAQGVELDRSMKLPRFDDANDKLKEYTMQGFAQRGLPKNKEYHNRILEELSLIIQKDFSSYFLIQKMMTDEARRKCPELLGWGDGSEACGPGRGSVGGSLVAYCLGITDVDPIKHDLLFSRFLSPARGGKSVKLKFASDPISQIEQVVNATEECPF
ncbi:MAG: PHP domain-containing protein [Crenarchaeota archaeon]|nr:MAG: PHP domain-containing protein [Thermoproteota archaeon]